MISTDQSFQHFWKADGQQQPQHLWAFHRPEEAQHNFLPAISCCSFAPQSCLPVIAAATGLDHSPPELKRRGCCHGPNHSEGTRRVPYKIIRAARSRAADARHPGKTLWQQQRVECGKYCGSEKVIGRRMWRAVGRHSLESERWDNSSCRRRRVSIWYLFY